MKPALQKRQSSGTVLTLVSSQPEPQPAAPRPRRRLRRFLAWAVGLILAVAALAATGYVIYEQLQDKAARKRYQEARLLAELDSPLGLKRALEILDALRRERPRDPNAAALRAEVLAFLWGRFEGVDSTRRAAREALDTALALQADDERLAALKGYHLLFEGRYAEAARLAESALLSHKSSARLGYVLGVARSTLGDLTAASATLKLAATQDPKFLPAWVALARVQRQRGRFKAAEQSIAHLVSVSPQHPEALVERALLRQARGDAADPAELQLLARQATPYPPLLALARLALARQALREGELGQARSLLQQAALAAPEDPEVGLALVESLLGDGGDARQGWALRARVQERAREYPRAPAVFAEIALAVGRPDEALRLLRRPPTAAVPATVTERALVVRVHAAWELEQPELADRLCQEVWEADTLGVRAQEACLVHAARRRQRRTLRAQAARLKGHAQQVAQALLHYARHQYDLAVEALTPLARRPETSGWTLILLADSLQRLERTAAAVPFLEQAVRRDAQSVRSRLARTQGLVAANRRAAATPAWNELWNEQSVGARTLLEIGELGLVLGRRAAVKALAERLERQHQTSGHAAYLQGRLALLGERDRRLARARFEAAQMREPGHLPSKLALASLSFERGDVDGGRQLLDEAFEASGKSPEVSLSLARAYFERNRIQEARATYVKAALQYRLLGATYRAAEVLAELGHRLSGIKRYRHRSVKRILRWALRLSDRPPRAHLRLGQFLEARGKLDEALLCYRRATRLGPELAEGFYHLGALLVAVHRTPEQGEQALARFLDLTRSPEGRRAQNARAWIARAKARREFFASQRQR